MRSLVEGKWVTESFTYYNNNKYFENNTFIHCQIINNTLFQLFKALVGNIGNVVAIHTDSLYLTHPLPKLDM